MYLNDPSSAAAAAAWQLDQPAFYGAPSVAAREWTREEQKRFESQLVLVPEDLPNRLSVIAERVGRAETEVLEHYEALLREVADIETGRVEVPKYGDAEEEEEEGDDGEYDEDGAVGNPGSQISFSGKRPGDGERKKGLPWTEEEHRSFLVGLQTYGRGDWRSISRQCVVSRTPTQVASHAQKFFLRQTAGKKDRKRTSIHDIKTVEMPTGHPANPNMAPPPQQQPHMMMQQMQPLNLPDQNVPMDYQNFGYQM